MYAGWNCADESWHILFAKVRLVHVEKTAHAPIHFSG
jgi:hypothetical protein